LKTGGGLQSRPTAEVREIPETALVSAIAVMPFANYQNGLVDCPSDSLSENIEPRPEEAVKPCYRYDRDSPLVWFVAQNVG